MTLFNLFSAAHTLECREHIVCVYGDNFFQSVKYKIVFLPLNGEEECTQTVELIKQVEPILTEKKKEMSKFQEEYMDLKRK